jgi:hypothetical protein
MMEHDYYQVLGVDATADPAAIWAAYKAAALVYHPDRGGTHERMLLINEARAILSDPEARRQHDAARAGDEAALAAAAADVARAQARAGEYPRAWPEFEAWLGRVAGDFTTAKYGSVPVFAGMTVPTTGRSLSGCLFVLVGAALGGVFVATVVVDVCERYQIKARGMFGAFLLLGPVIAGAWVGAAVHQGIGEKLRQAAEQRQRSAEAAVRRGREAAARAANRSRQVVCGRCGQKLRVPAAAGTLVVTCGGCGGQFDLPADAAGGAADP